jgi:hypothetical protein
MAKQFAGFTPQQTAVLLQKMGYTGSSDSKAMQQFLASNPAAAARLGKYTETAQRMIAGQPAAKTMPPAAAMGMQEGGYVVNYNNQFPGFETYDVMGPKGVTGMFKSQADAQAAADKLNAGSNTGLTATNTELTANTTSPLTATSPMSAATTGSTQPAGSLGPLPDAIAQPNPFTTVTNAITGTATGAPTATTTQYSPAGTAAQTAWEEYKSFKGAPGDMFGIKKFAGRTFTDPATGTTYTSDGSKWIVSDAGANKYLLPDGTTSYINPDFQTLPEGSQDISTIGATGPTTGIIDVGSDIPTPPPEGASSTEIKKYEKALQDYREKAAIAASQLRSDPEAINRVTSQLNTATVQRNNYLLEIQNLPADDPRRTTLSNLIAEADKNISALQQQANTLQNQQLKAGQQALVTKAYTAPEELVTKAATAPVNEAAAGKGEIAAGTGSLGAAPTVSGAAVTAGQAGQPGAAQAVTFDAVKATPGVESVVQQTKAVTGTVSPDAQVTAQTMDSSTLAQLGMTAEQLATAQTVKAPPPREVQAGELISGPAVDMARVEELVSNVQAAEATPSDMATVQGQMAQLLQQFEGKEPPAWAAGAMRKATATLAARGLGASSMAGQAIVQAAMESALPIAMQDAQTRASFEAQNLSNRQQVAMFAAQQRASFLGMEFDQQFQTRVQNAARIADIANMNFSADVQIALENSRNAQSVDLANLNARNAKLLADLAAMTQVDLTNLNNRQQAAVQNAASFLQMDMQNLTNAQQTMMFNSQARIQALLTDAASENASRQFNATSQMQVDQFNKNLAAQIDQFNTAQANAVAQFNAQEANAIAKFNAEVKNARDVFEAQNALVIAQSNAKWRQEITTLETQQQHQANMQAAAAATQMTQATIESVWQRERDTMAFAFQASENAADRATQIAVAKLTADEQAKLQDNIGKGTLAATVLDKTLDWALNQ